MDKNELADRVRAAAAGDQGAWDELVVGHRNLLRSIAKGYRLSDTQVDDVVQTAWLRLVEHIGRLRQPEQVTGWLVTTVRRECLSVLRSTRREQPCTSDADDFWGAVGSAEDTVVTEENRELVRSAVRRLPDRQRTLIGTLMWTPELDYRQVGERLAMPVGSIGPTRARALTRVRELLDPAASPLAA